MRVMRNMLVSTTISHLARSSSLVSAGVCSDDDDNDEFKSCDIFPRESAHSFSSLTPFSHPTENSRVRETRKRKTWKTLEIARRADSALRFRACDVKRAAHRRLNIYTDFRRCRNNNAGSDTTLREKVLKILSTIVACADQMIKHDSMSVAETDTFFVGRRAGAQARGHVRLPSIVREFMRFPRHHCV